MKKALTVFAVVLLALFCSCGVNEQNCSVSSNLVDTQQNQQSNPSMQTNSSSEISRSDNHIVVTHDQVIELFCYYLEAYDNIIAKCPISIDDSRVDIAYKVAKQVSTNFEKISEHQLATVCMYYQQSPFFNADIEVISCETAKVVLGNNEIGYKIEINVKKSASPYLQEGLQAWYVAISDSMDGSPFFAPIGYWAYEKFEAIDTVPNYEMEEKLANIYRYCADRATFEINSIDEIPFEDLLWYVVWISTPEPDDYGGNYSEKEIEAMIEKCIGKKDVDITKSKYYDVESDTLDFYHVLPMEVSPPMVVWHTKQEDNNVYLWCDIINNQDEFRPQNTYCFAFDSSYEIPHLLWVKEVTDTNAASFYINEEIKIPR